MNRRTRVLPPQPALPQEQERRHFQRHQPTLAAQSHLVATEVGEMWPQSIHTISAGGISLIVDRPIAPGSTVTLDLYHIARKFFCQLSVRVISLTEEDGTLVMRGAFERELTEEELQGLL